MSRTERLEEAEQALQEERGKTQQLAEELKEAHGRHREATEELEGQARTSVALRGKVALHASSLEAEEAKVKQLREEFDQFLLKRKGSSSPEEIAFIEEHLESAQGEAFTAESKSEDELVSFVMEVQKLRETPTGEAGSSTRVRWQHGFRKLQDQSEVIADHIRLYSTRVRALLLDHIIPRQMIPIALLLLLSALHSHSCCCFFSILADDGLFQVVSRRAAYRHRDGSCGSLRS